MPPPKVAVVTGGNRGIGYEIVKGLCEKFHGKVYLTARDEKRGNSAVIKLYNKGFKAIFHQLDITDQISIDKFREYIKQNEGGIDVLINNAAIAFKEQDASRPFSEIAGLTVNVNYFCTLRACEVLFPLLRPHAQVVNVTSSLGHSSKIVSPELRAKFKSSKLSIQKLNNLMKEFMSDAKKDKNVELKWGNSAYAVSKVGVSALTFIQQKMFDNEPEKRDISINCVHPGYVDTDLHVPTGRLDPEQGASAPLFLALGGHYFRGQYIWNDSTLADWHASCNPGYLI